MCYSFIMLVSTYVAWPADGGKPSPHAPLAFAWRSSPRDLIPVYQRPSAVNSPVPLPIPRFIGPFLPALCPHLPAFLQQFVRLCPPLPAFARICPPLPAFLWALPGARTFLSARSPVSPSRISQPASRIAKSVSLCPPDFSFAASCFSDRMADKCYAQGP